MASAGHALPAKGGGFFARPTATTGFWSWFTTVDHKKIGILYGFTAFAFFIIGGLEALVIRAQLAGPDGEIVDAELYNQLFTMHGLTMVFLVVMPLSAAFFNYLIPLMIGARDVAFPRLNAFSYWVFLFGGLFMYSSFVLGGAPNGGWFGYAPVNVQAGEIGALNNMTFYAIGLLILGIASTVSAVNLAVTIINMRAPGMSFFRMPVFIWMAFVVQFLLIFALPIITVGLFLLLFDRILGTSFYASGGDPVLWQHLFWLFGHPEVYILILPAMGIVSEILPTFSRKPLFGYSVVVFSGIAIGIMGWGVWAHHMFTTGLGPVANSAFAVSTMFIAVPTGVKIFNWIATTWGGKIRLATPMLFALGFVAMFTIGGLSGVTHSVVPHDTQQTDTYYVVAHFHYVLFGGAILGLFGGVYYWWPKIFGRVLNEGLGKIHFWLMLIGFNLTFGPFHILGLQGMPRRIYRYPDGMGWNAWNMAATVGSFLIAVSVLVFMWNAVRSRTKGEIAVADPWDGRTLEWTISSPPPAHNFDEVPVVHALDDFWHRKYVEDKGGQLVRVPSGGQEEPGATDAHGTEQAAHGAEQAAHGGSGHGIHMPSPSYMPILTSFGLPMVGYGLMYGYWLSIAGAVVLLTGLYGWALEPDAE
ncbi:MAG TPA: cytochrome c oxidase subunit I [Actinomycetota bacterium]